MTASGILDGAEIKEEDDDDVVILHTENHNIKVAHFIDPARNMEQPVQNIVYSKQA